jgi:hypothetical protein
MDSKSDEKFSAEESQKRFEAALKGARIAGHKPMESLIRKNAKSQPEKASKPAKKVRP